MRKKLHETAKAEESAILIAVETPFQELSSQEYLDELDQLVRTAGATPKKRFIQKLDHPNPKSYVGKGKLEEIQAYVAEHEIDIAVLDDELSPAQIRNLETDLKNVKVLTRTHLILDIFAKTPKRPKQKPRWN